MLNRSINLQAFDTFPDLETERLSLTAFSLANPQDVDCAFRLRSDPQVNAYLDRTVAQSADEAVEYIRNLDLWFSMKESVQWAIRLKETGLAVGSFCFWNIRQAHCRAEVGYSLLPEYWRQGVMQEVGARLLDFGRDQLALHSVDANINPKNVASRQLLLSLGFEKEGYFKENYQYQGCFTDSEMYGKVLGR